jgi:hypothetical protein
MVNPVVDEASNLGAFSVGQPCAAMPCSSVEKRELGPFQGGGSRSGRAGQVSSTSIRLMFGERDKVERRVDDWKVVLNDNPFRVLEDVLEKVTGSESECGEMVRGPAGWCYGGKLVRKNVPEFEGCSGATSLSPIGVRGNPMKVEAILGGLTDMLDEVVCRTFPGG